VGSAGPQASGPKLFDRFSELGDCTCDQHAVIANAAINIAPQTEDRREKAGFMLRSLAERVRAGCIE